MENVWNSSIGVFQQDDGILLERAPNGGWIVSTRPGSMGQMPTVIGAYGSAAEMLKALGENLS